MTLFTRPGTQSGSFRINSLLLREQKLIGQWYKLFSDTLVVCVVLTSSVEKWKNLSSNTIQFIYLHKYGTKYYKHTLGISAAYFVTRIKIHIV